MNPACAEQNEQNTVTIEGEGHRVIFKQIAGLLARRIVFTKKVGDSVRRGERVGLIKFGSRTDVLLDPSAEVAVKVGDNVKGGSSILAFLKQEKELAGTAVTARATEELLMDEQLSHPLRRKEDQRPRRFRKGLYILPSLFTAANVLLGYYAILQVIHGAFRTRSRTQCRFRSRSSSPGISIMPPKPLGSRFCSMDSTGALRA